MIQLSRYLKINTLKNEVEEMRSLRYMDRRTGNRLASIALILGTLVPSLLPALAFAAQVSDRSLTLSSATAGEAGVTYEIKFAIPSSGDEGSDADSFVLDFCSNSPIPGQACTAPAGLNTTGVNTSTSGATVTALTGSATTGKSAVQVDKTYTAGSSVDVVLTGIHNPTTAGALYGRIVTYDTTAHAGAYDAETLGAGAQDNGGVAVAIVNNIGVTAAVRETMTFCVANQTITADCGDAATAGHQPTLEIGEGSAGLKALDATHVSTADIFAQLSTNAASGAIVRLKSDATSCGGLVRVGGTSGNCDIKPADGTTITNVTVGNAAFGIKPASASTTVGSGSGTLQSINSYSNSAYRLNFASNNSSGITSTYGDDILDSDGAPVNNKQMQFTFGASASNLTPAGTYKANLSMIASGTY